MSYSSRSVELIEQGSTTGDASHGTPQHDIDAPDETTDLRYRCYAAAVGVGYVPRRA